MNMCAKEVKNYLPLDLNFCTHCKVYKQFYSMGPLFISFTSKIKTYICVNTELKFLSHNVNNIYNFGLQMK